MLEDIMQNGDIKNLAHHYKVNLADDGSGPWNGFRDSVPQGKASSLLVLGHSTRQHMLVW
jgi:hypothetical protein